MRSVLAVLLTILALEILKITVSTHFSMGFAGGVLIGLLLAFWEAGRRKRDA